MPWWFWMIFLQVKIHAPRRTSKSSLCMLRLSCVKPRMSAPDIPRIQPHHIGCDSAELTTAMDRIAFAIGRFQPDTFLLGCVHAETFYQKTMVHAKGLRLGGRAPASQESEEASQELRL